VETTVTDKEARQQQRRLGKLIDRWKKRLGMEAWDISHYFDRERFEDNPNTLAETKADWRYEHASISWSLPVVEQHADDELERIVVHEYLHCLTDQLKRYALREHEETADMHQVEQSVTVLTLAVVFAYRTGLQERRK
jgi:predicted SprT family Zn-dependent metalloprotease